MTLPRFATAALIAALPEVCLAQVITENAGVASPELPALREAFTMRQSRAIDELRLDSQLLWSPAPWFETRTTLPHVWRDGITDWGGFGDLAVRGKHSLWQHDEVIASTRFAALYELSLPTGDDEDLDAAGNRLPPKLQPGAGAFGLGLGSAFTWIRDRHRASAEVFYRHTLDHDGFELGDRLSCNLAYWYRLSPATFRAGPERDPLEVRGVLELLSTYRFESRAAAGLGDQGTEVWLAPGLQLFGNGRVLFEASVQVPIFQDVDDAFGRREWAATLAVKILF